MLNFNYIFVILVSFGCGQVFAKFKEFTNSEIIENLGERGLEFAPDIIEDSLLKVDELIKKYNYESEVHFVTTEDGYILRLHRIRGRNGGSQPVFLQHGLADSSAGFVVMGPEISLGYLLSDLHYDVWLGNSRGNRYSRNHTTLNPDHSPEFWDFSFHDLGLYDVPAMIDYILKTTEHQKLHYIGHSQGCSAFFVMCSMKPEYNKKIISMQGLAPAVYLTHIRAASRKLATGYFLTQNPLRGIFGTAAVEMANGKDIKKSCLKSPANEKFCIDVVETLFGRNPDEFNATMLPVIFSHSPAGISSKQSIHFLQVSSSERFAQFSYGLRENKKRYGTGLPPKYNISQVTVPVALYYSMNDMLTDYRDIQQLYSELRNPIKLFRIAMWNFNHADYVWGIHARALVYNDVVSVLKEYDSYQ